MIRRVIDQDIALDFDRWYVRFFGRIAAIVSFVMLLHVRFLVGRLIMAVKVFLRVACQ